MMLLWPRLWIIKRIPYMALCLLLGGCFSTARTPATVAEAAVQATAESMSNLDMMSAIGGISILGGIIALVITKGQLGARAIFCGVGLVLLNYAVARYAHWIFIPILVATAAISLTYGYRIVRQAITRRNSQ